MEQGRNLLNVFNRSSSPQQQQRNPNMQLDSSTTSIEQRTQQQPSSEGFDDYMRTLQSQSPHSQNPNPPGAYPKPLQQNQPATGLGTYQSPSAQTGQGPSSSSTTPVSSSTANSQSDNRQNALMSLLGTMSNNPSQNQPPRAPTPPNQSTKLSSPPNTESQGVRLLEQLMSTGSNQPAQPALGNQAQYEYAPSYNPQPQQSPTAASQQPPPSPTRRSMFDFTSPFDAFSNSASSTAATKRKPVPGQIPHPNQSSEEESSLSNPNQLSGLDSMRTDPKRKSVENLMETLTRPGGSTMDTPHGRSQGISSRTTSESKPTVTKQPVPASPPQTFAQVQAPIVPQVARNAPPRPNSPPVASTNVANRDVHVSQKQESSSSSWRGTDPKSKQTGRDARQQQPTTQPQNIYFDVSQPLEGIQAPPDSSLSTPIALVKVEPTFLPGSTIGATSWIAYAMTRGRVRVISRASGDRTLLQLPPTFPPTTSVVDMAVFANRLAGVTSDGGFVVWELPPVIVDDVPGKLLLCVVPPPDPEALRSVRWHPKKPETVAVASESKIYLLSINEAFRRFGNDPVAQSDLMQVGPVITLSSPLVAFAFDVPHFAIATISEDSTLELWRITNQLPFWSAKIPGESSPSSIDFLDGGIVIGRKNGTILQLLSVMSETILSTIRFIDTQNKDDRDMFGHVAYDGRIQTLWVANSRRESLIALKVHFEPNHEGDDQPAHGFFQQIAEFVGPKPSIHFVILTADSDPNGEEAHAACVAAKVQPSPIALVAFSVHSSGVDQIIIRQEWFETALLQAPSKFPTGNNPFQQQVQQVPLPLPRSAAVNFGNLNQPIVAPIENPRPQTPPSEVEAEPVREELRASDPKARGGKNKAVGFKEEGSKESREREKLNSKSAEQPQPTEWSGSSPWSKDLRKMEESLHTRVGRMLSKESEKQMARIEELREADKKAEVARQEMMLKLISAELTKNTTRVVEMAVKAEVQSSVLPALENITRNEVKAAVNGQITRGLGESMKQTLPNEMERLLMRPDLSNHVARTFSSAVTPIIERHVKETITKTLIPAYAAESSAMHQEVSRELHTEILNLKKEVITWQSDALRGQEAIIRDLEQSIRTLQEQIKYMSMNYAAPGPAASAQHMHQHRGSPVLATATSPHAMPTHLRGNYNPASSYTQSAPNPNWYNPNVSTSHGPILQQTMGQTQSSAKAALSSVSGGAATPDTKSEDWDETYLAVLGTQDPRQLRELLARSNPEVVMPMNGAGPLSQAVVLTLVHRLSAAVGETSPVDEAFKTSLWWLQRAANTLNTNDPLISPYVGRVLPNVQAMLNTTKSRLSLLPGGPPLLEASRVISDVQEIVVRKSG